MYSSANDTYRTCQSIAFFSNPIPSHPDNPLSSTKSHTARKASARLQYLRPQIRRDANKRRSREIFDSPSSASTTSPSQTSTAASSPAFEGECERWTEALHRLLYVWAVLNPGLGYVQGMSEIAAPLLYVYAQSSSPQHAEADAFSTFSKLLGTGLANLYSREEDEERASESGLHAAMTQILSIVRSNDPQLANHLDEQGVEPAYFAVRWLTCALAQNADLPTVFLLWDYLFSAIPSPSLPDQVFSSFMQALLDLCAAIVLSLRERLLAAGFSLAIAILQDYRVDDAQKLTEAARMINQQRMALAMCGEEQPETAISNLSKRFASVKMWTPPAVSTEAAAQSAASTSKWFLGKYSSLRETDAAATFAKASSNLQASAMSLRENSKKMQNLDLSSYTPNLLRSTSPSEDAPFDVPAASPTPPTGSFSPIPEHANGIKPLLLGSMPRSPASLPRSPRLSPAGTPRRTSPELPNSAPAFPPSHGFAPLNIVKRAPSPGIVGYVSQPTYAQKRSHDRAASIAIVPNHGSKDTDEPLMRGPARLSRLGNRRPGSTPVSPAYSRRSVSVSGMEQQRSASPLMMETRSTSPIMQRRSTSAYMPKRHSSPIKKEEVKSSPFLFPQSESIKERSLNEEKDVIEVLNDVSDEFEEQEVLDDPVELLEDIEDRYETRSMSPTPLRFSPTPARYSPVARHSPPATRQTFRSDILLDPPPRRSSQMMSRSSTNQSLQSITSSSGTKTPEYEHLLDDYS